MSCRPCKAERLAERCAAMAKARLDAARLQALRAVMVPKWKRIVAEAYVERARKLASGEWSW